MDEIKYVKIGPRQKNYRKIDLDKDIKAKFGYLFVIQCLNCGYVKASNKHYNTYWIDVEPCYNCDSIKQQLKIRHVITREIEEIKVGW